MNFSRIDDNNFNAAPSENQEHQRDPLISGAGYIPQHPQQSNGSFSINRLLPDLDHQDQGYGMRQLDDVTNTWNDPVNSTLNQIPSANYQYEDVATYNADLRQYQMYPHAAYNNENNPPNPEAPSYQNLDVPQEQAFETPQVIQTPQMGTPGFGTEGEGYEGNYAPEGQEMHREEYLEEEGETYYEEGQEQVYYEEEVQETPKRQEGVAKKPRRSKKDPTQDKTKQRSRFFPTYCILAGLVLLNHIGESLQVREMYEWLKFFFPGCTDGKYFDNSIRENLSQHENGKKNIRIDRQFFDKIMEMVGGRERASYKLQGDGIVRFMKFLNKWAESKNIAQLGLRKGHEDDWYKIRRGEMGKVPETNSTQYSIPVAPMNHQLPQSPAGATRTKSVAITQRQTPYPTSRVLQRQPLSTPRGTSVSHSQQIGIMRTNMVPYFIPVAQMNNQWPQPTAGPTRPMSVARTQRQTHLQRPSTPRMPSVSQLQHQGAVNTNVIRARDTHAENHPPPIHPPIQDPSKISLYS